MAPLAVLVLILHQVVAPLTGVVRDTTGLPLAGVVITVKGTERFAVSDGRGAFTLAGAPAGTVIVAALPGFKSREVRVPDPAGAPFAIVLTLAGITETVAVRASAPPASTQGLIAVTPIDVVRTPGTQADLMRALGTQPGVAQIDEGAGLFVRGGDVSEVLVLLDGVVVSHPYRYETPTGGFRGAIDPFLTQGAAFTTGGFSAQYGNSLSAVVDLQTLGRPRDRQANVTAGLAGVSASIAQPIGPRSGVRFAANRTTPSLLFAVNPSPKRFDQLPGGWDASGSLSTEHPRLGSVRVLVLSQRDHVGVELEKDAFIGFLHSATRHGLLTARWERRVLDWTATLSAGNDSYTKSTDVGVLAVDEREQHRSGRAQLVGPVGAWHLHIGADVDAVQTTVVGRVPARGGDFGGVSGASDFAIAHRDWRAGGFAVASRRFGRLTPEAGLRADRFDAARETTIDPRVALRVSLSTGHALRLAAGRYHQTPSPSYFDAIRGAVTLPAMAATHAVLGYELGTPAQPVFARVEVYRKRYRDLPLQDDETGFSGRGYGSATGVDLFARRTWPRLDLKVSASLLDAARRWTSSEQRDRYPLPAGKWSPDFEIPYSIQAVVNASLTRAVSVAASWRTAAGRPFTPAVGASLTATGYEPTWGPINADRLPRYERLDLSISLLTPFGAGGAAVFFASVDNLLGRQNAFDVAYSADYSTRRLITTSTPRSFYIGCSISITK